MRKRFATILTILFFGFCHAEARTRIERSGAGAADRGGGGASAPAGPVGSRAPQPPVVIKMHQYNTPVPNRIRNPNHIVRDRNQIDLPQHDDTGEPIHQRSMIDAPQQHTTIVRNPALMRDIRHEQRTEIVPGRYYWHIDNGVRYCHLYDGGAHWYGFYMGPTFYWTRYYHDRWWWFDARFSRWSYWWDGYWWWPSPTGVLYVYVDNNYYPYENGEVTVRRPELQAPPDAAPASSNEGTSVTSPDGRRMVQTIGEKGYTFLYDMTSGKPVFLKYLADGVENVRFSTTTGDKPTRILLEFKDGNFAVFSTDGNPIDK